MGKIDYIKCNFVEKTTYAGGVISLEKIYSDKLYDGEFIVLEDKGIVIIGTKVEEGE